MRFTLCPFQVTSVRFGKDAAMRSKAFVLRASRFLQGDHSSPFLLPQSFPSPRFWFNLHSGKPLCLLVEVAPENTGALPKLREIVQENAGALQKLREIAPENAGALQKLPEIAPENAGALQKLREIAPENAGSLQKFREIAPENAGALQKLPEIGIHDAFFAHSRFTSSSSLDLLEKIELLLKQGVSVEQLNHLFRRAGRNIDSHFINVPFQRVEALLILFKSIGIQKQDLGKILIRHPAILSSRIERLESKLKFIESLGIAHAEVGKYFQKCPRAFLGADKKQNERLEFWQNLGLSKKSLCTMIRRFPHVLSLNIEQKVQPLIAHFYTYGISKDLLCSKISYRPYCLALSMENLSQKMEFLQQLGFKGNSKAILMAYFELSNYSPKLLQSRVEWLISKGFSMDEIGHMVQKFHGMLVLRPENIGKKLDYFLNVLKRDRKEILNFPACLIYSLDKRIQPRFATLAETQGQGTLSLESSLSSILLRTDDVFRKRVTCRRGRPANMDGPKC